MPVEDVKLQELQEQEWDRRNSECGEILLGKRCSLWIKENICKSYVRSAMLYGSETWLKKK